MRIYRAAALALPLAFLVACHTPAQEHAATVAPAAYGRDPYVTEAAAATPALVPVPDGVVVPPTTQRAPHPVARAHPAPAELPDDTSAPDPPASLATCDRTWTPPPGVHVDESTLADPCSLPECWHYHFDDYGNETYPIDPDPSDAQGVPPTPCWSNPTPEESAFMARGYVAPPDPAS